MNKINYPYIEDYIRGLLPESQGLLKEMEVYAKDKRVPIVAREVGQLLQLITRAIGAKRVLEVGTAIGYSALVFAQAMGPEGQVTTIERDEKIIPIAKENIKKAGQANNIEILEGDAAIVLGQLGGQYDLIFLDGAKGHYRSFLDQSMGLLRPGGLLVSDNILYKGMVATDELVVPRQRTIVKRMREYLDYICSHPDLETSIIAIGDGLAISYKKQEEK